MKCGDRKGMDKALMPIQPAGMLRANLGARQYNIFRLSKRPMPEADPKDSP